MDDKQNRGENDDATRGQHEVDTKYRHLSCLCKEERHHSKCNAETAVSTRTCLSPRSNDGVLWGTLLLNERSEGRRKCSKDWSSWCGGAGKLERDSVVYATLRALVNRHRAVTDQEPQAPCVTQGESKR